jgi:hypothetical protein
VKHADAWKTEEDSNKRIIRLSNLVELFKICEILKSVVIEQLRTPLNNDSDDFIDASQELTTTTSSDGDFKGQIMKNNFM